uniref:Uncharacterized protein n=1 Tax=Tetraodon nigroviridis TaxID=99883 RepID=H3CYC7_TETNG
MFRIVLVFLLLSGLQAAPLAVLPKASFSLPDGFQQGSTQPDVFKTVADGFRQGTEPSRRFLVDLNTGLVKEHISEMDRRAFIPPLGKEKVVIEPWLADDGPVDLPVERNGGGWVRVEDPSAQLPLRFRQGTEPQTSMPEGFRQGTEP